MGIQPSKLHHLLQHQKFTRKNSPKLNLKKNKLIVLKRAVAGANKWRNINKKNGSIIELLNEIEQNEHQQNEENIEMEEKNNLQENREIILYPNTLNEIKELKQDKYQQKYFLQNHKITTLEELTKMQKEMEKALNTLKSKLEKLEEDQQRKIKICVTKWGIEMLKNSVEQQKTLNPDTENRKNNKKRRKLQTITEECRLRSALLTDKFKNCNEYLRGFEVLISTIQREKECNAEGKKKKGKLMAHVWPSG
ncbi:hypothetical protein Mgra_00004866 [Meloidogyne graminicola]|uniref:Uncharacterized protein n=1 Tax=Meloidogyne graminicola TaxID=189291 RepID=A0A8S9ZRB0_9BILA|nr:hypothetical protein Mgra_00004866 [Meloidogyne graminicola]